MDSNPALGLLGFWMMLQLAATIAIVLGGIYALYCLGRAASGLDRMASALEEWVAKQNAASTPVLPGSAPSTPLAQRLNLPPEVPNISAQSTPVSASASPITPPPVNQQSPVNQAPIPNPAAVAPTEYSRTDESTA